MSYEKILKKEHTLFIHVLDLLVEKHAEVIRDFLALSHDYQRLTFLITNEKAIWCMILENPTFTVIAELYGYKENMSTIEYLKFIRRVEHEKSLYTHNEQKILKESLTEILKNKFPKLF